MRDFLLRYRLRVARDKLANYTAQAEYWGAMLNRMKTVRMDEVEAQAQRVGIIAELKARIERLEKS